MGGAIASAPAQVVVVEEASQVGEARRAATAMAEVLGFDEHARSDIAVVASELATNLARYAKRGAVLLQVIESGGGTGRGIELVAVDGGPGMADPAQCLTDGFSTGGTQGAGLGAVRRLASEFALDSHIGRGTVVVARLWRDRGARPASPDGYECGAVAIAAPGETACGDAWAVQRQEDGRVVAVVADGLGHGDLAAAASRLAIETLRAHGGSAEPTELLQRMHDALRATRGAAVAVIALDGTTARFAGVGNIAGAVVAGGEQRHMVSHNGIVGHQVHKLQEFTYACPPGAMVILASDGLRTQWRLEAYPGLALRDPTVAAATLWRDYTRTRDDATVLVLRVPEASVAR